ncbi:hypothetical protein LBMAG42_10210 [Deltaproteobacteria bacterium]|nr:hypothetical protein LBMAG42_10210 [Deltaproteobacteria bacterium]
MRQNTKGFSLVELMIVVAIIGILAAIAIPNFVAMQLKSKRAEVPSNVAGIKTAELAYDASFDGFQSNSTYPRASADLDKTLVAWAVVDGSGFANMGWEPDGMVRGNYAAALSGSNDFQVTAKCDVDNDDTVATYTASKTVANTLQAGDEDVY